MKKRILTVISVIFCLLASTAIVNAADSSIVKATITKLKIYFNDQKLSGNVITYNKVTYVPVNILSDSLGFKVTKSTSANKLTITEKVSKNQLQEQIDKLEADVDDLNEKLELYRGDIPDDSTYKTITNFTYEYYNGRIYNYYWNRVTPFKVSGKVYDNKAYGIYFQEGEADGENVYFPAFIFKNDDLKYSKLKFSLAIDDLAKSFDFPYSSTSVQVIGYSSILGNNTLLDQYINRGVDIDTCEVDIKGYDSIKIQFIPGTTGGYIEQKSSSYWGHFGYYKDYILLINPEVK